MVNLALDFGGTNIKIGIVREGDLLDQTIVPARSEVGIRPRLRDVEVAAKALLAQQGLTAAECGGVGLALPGLVDPIRKSLLSINKKYEDAVGLPFETWAMERFGLRLAMENDARAALLGEAAYGEAKGASDAVLMIFGTGIGTAALMNGQLVRGKNFQAGVLGGHMTTNVHGRACICGNVGCLEAQASHWALPQLAKQFSGYTDSRLVAAKRIDYFTVMRAVEAGDAMASALLEELLLYWSAGIVNLIHAYDPEMVVLSGGLMKSAERIVPRLAERVHRYAWTSWGRVDFKVARNPDASVLLGVSRLVELEKGKKHGSV